MSDYVKTVDFAAKDALASGNPNKVALGAQVDTEFNNIATAISTKEDQANKGQANGYASLDANGEIPDSQISDNFPRLDESNTFEGTLTISTGGQSELRISNAANNADNRIWAFVSTGLSSLRRLIGIAREDDGTSQFTWLDVQGNGGTATVINLSATSVQANSQTIWTAGNDGPSSGLNADLLDGEHASAFADAVHIHSAADITSGTLAIARGGTGQTDGTARNITGRPGVTKTLSTSAPSGGSDGDIWYRYS